MFLLESIKRSPNRVDYEYSYPKAISKYFTNKKLYLKTDVDLSTVPEEILTIPLLGNILPVSWFVGFDVKVSRLDKTFYDAAQELKTQFAVYYPQINEKSSELIVDELIDFKEQESTKTAMLFSGGVDAYTTLLRHYEEQPDLITIHGADIAIEDEKQWENVVAYNASTEAIKANAKYSIEINLREFLTYEIESLLEGQGWWGRIQHGMALTTATAPISYVNHYKTVYIGSTRSSKMPFSPWGSMPEIDDKVRFGNTFVSHDGYELTRLNKIQVILKLSDKYKVRPPLRVCYSDFKEYLNCGKCEKCCRTIFAMQLQNRNPSFYGLNGTINTYQLIKKHLDSGFSTEGIKFYWNEMLNEIDLDNFYYYKDKGLEMEKLNEIEVSNKTAQNRGVVKKTDSKLSVMKFKFINNYPKLFNLYLRVRRKFI